MTNFKFQMRKVAAIAACLAVAIMFSSCKKDDPKKTVAVAAQVGTMTAGETQMVTFAVTTENIADGSYTPQVANLPTGITAQGKVDISANKGTLTLAGSATTQAGTPDNLTLTIDGATSKKFTLTVTAATYSISANPTTLPFGSLSEGYEQHEEKIVTITNNGTGTITLNALPSVTNYTLGTLSKTTLAAGETASFTVRPNTNLAVGTHNREINVTGTGNTSAKVNAEFEVAVFLLEEVQWSGARNVFEYDDKDRIKKYTHYIGGQLLYVSTLKYDDEGDMIEEKHEDQRDPANNSITTLTRNGNTITCTSNNGGVTCSYELNAEGFPIKATWVAENITATYTWHNGNLIKEEQKEGSYSYTYTYTYDEYKTPMHNCKSPKWVLHFWSWNSGLGNKNNLKTVDLEEGDDDETYEYTYNNDGFPLTQTMSSYSITYTYKYKKK